MRSVLLRTQTDARLVALARTGHDRAFEAIVERYRRPLLRACRQILPEARAEDALQQALVAAWTALRRGDEVRELRPWLYRIVRNTALNQLRVTGYDLDELVDTLATTDDPEEEVARRALVRQTLAAVAALPDRQRDALLRTAVEGQGQDEVARDLGLSSTAVRQLVHRARVSVRTAATAVVPLPLAAWLAAAGARVEPMTPRIVELVAGAGAAGGSATLAKAGAVAVLAGGAVAAPVVIDAPPDPGGTARKPAISSPAVAAAAGGGGPETVSARTDILPAGNDPRGDAAGSADGEDDGDDRHGRRGEDESGRRRGEDDDDDRQGRRDRGDERDDRDAEDRDSRRGGGDEGDGPGGDADGGDAGGGDDHAEDESSGEADSSGGDDEPPAAGEGSGEPDEREAHDDGGESGADHGTAEDPDGGEPPGDDADEH